MKTEIIAPTCQHTSPHGLQCLFLVNDYFVTSKKFYYCELNPSSHTQPTHKKATGVAQYKGRTSIQVMISRFVGSSPSSRSVL